MKNAIFGIIRHILTAAAGGLAANGTITDTQLEQGIGAILFLAGLGWSIWDKKKAGTPDAG